MPTLEYPRGCFTIIGNRSRAAASRTSSWSLAITNEGTRTPAACAAIFIAVRDGS